MKPEAGPDLDALVHVKVMGFPNHPSGKGYPWAHVPNYSTDSAAAVEVAAKLALQVVLIDKQCVAVRPAPVDYDLGEGREADLRKGIIDGRMAPLAVAPTAPLAICRAALRLVEEQ